MLKMCEVEQRQTMHPFGKEIPKTKTLLLL